MLAIFPKFKATQKICKEIAKDLNNVDREELGFICDGRFLFSQKALENCLLPDVFYKYISYIE